MTSSLISNNPHHPHPSHHRHQHHHPEKKVNNIFVSVLFESLPTSLNGWITGWWLDNWMPYIPPPTRYVAKASAQLCNSQPRNSLEWNSGGTDVQIDFYWNVKVYDLKWCSTCLLSSFKKVNNKQQTHDIGQLQTWSLHLFFSPFPSPSFCKTHGRPRWTWELITLRKPDTTMARIAVQAHVFRPIWPCQVPFDGSKCLSLLYHEWKRTVGPCNTLCCHPRFSSLPGLRSSLNRSSS